MITNNILGFLTFVSDNQTGAIIKMSLESVGYDDQPGLESSGDSLTTFDEVYDRYNCFFFSTKTFFQLTTTAVIKHINLLTFEQTGWGISRSIQYCD